MSKGSNRRPRAVSQQQFAENWDSVFGKEHRTTFTPPNASGENNILAVLTPDVIQAWHEEMKAALANQRTNHDHF